MNYKNFEYSIYEKTTNPEINYIEISQRPVLFNSIYGKKCLKQMSITPLDGESDVKVYGN